jgi:hypothetical protein
VVRFPLGHLHSVALADCHDIAAMGPLLRMRAEIRTKLPYIRQMPTYSLKYNHHRPPQPDGQSPVPLNKLYSNLRATAPTSRSYFPEVCDYPTPSRHASKCWVGLREERILPKSLKHKDFVHRSMVNTHFALISRTVEESPSITILSCNVSLKPRVHLVRTRASCTSVSTSEFHPNGHRTEVYVTRFGLVQLEVMFTNTDISMRSGS